MEGISKIARNLNFNRGREGSGSRMDRDYTERRRTMTQSIGIEQIRGVVNDSNENQLDTIQDMLYDERTDREASDKELLRAIDSNAKLLNKNFRLLNDIKDDMDMEDGFDIKELSEANKEEILNAVFSNRDMLNLLKKELVDKKEEGGEWTDRIFDKESAEKAFIDLEDHVHKENVKCYRNVQAVVEEVDEKSFVRIRKGLTAIKVLLAFALAFGIANMAFLICWYLRII
ncbi:MAG: hypothetical protein K6F34_09180 [Lachnospiraceae bacterium]|nr:hypothetical protein [Lachnospiraceae bacterium]